MKKLLPFLLVVIMLVSIVALPSSAATTFKAASGTAVIDGKMDDAYKAADAVVIKLNNDGVAVTGATGVLYTLWDSANLYFFVDVTDPKVGTKKNSNEAAVYQSDSVEVYIDLVNDGKDNKIADIDAGQYTAGILYTSPMTWAGSGAHYTANKANAKFAIVKTDKGYAAEFQIPFGSKYTPKADAVIGFTAAINDDSNDDATRDTQAFVSKGQSQAWSVSGSYDRLKLSADKYTAPVTSTAAKTTAAAQTSDVSLVIAAAASLLSLAGVVVSKKRK